MTNYAHGHEAERAAAAYLRCHAFEVLELNWRHRRAEIDIIARRRHRFGRRGAVVFFEVKYRRTGFQGTGFDYITPRKLEQMRYAAELWMQAHDYSGKSSLGAIEMTGSDYRIVRLLEDIEG